MTIETKELVISEELKRKVEMVLVQNKKEIILKQKLNYQKNKMRNYDKITIIYLTYLKLSYKH